MNREPVFRNKYPAKPINKQCKSYRARVVEIIACAIVVHFLWKDRWQMQFIINRCKVFSVGRRDPQYRYTLNNEVLIGSEYEKDLEVIATSDLGLRKQCIKPRNKVNKILGLIFRSVKSINPEAVLKLYLLLVKQHLDYAAQLYFPHYMKDIGLLESTQRRMSKGI